MTATDAWYNDEWPPPDPPPPAQPGEPLPRRPAWLLLVACLAGGIAIGYTAARLTTASTDPSAAQGADDVRPQADENGAPLPARTEQPVTGEALLLRARIDELERLLADAQAATTRAQAQVEEGSKETERYRRGLERAVDELNRSHRSGRDAAPPSGAATTGSPPPPPPARDPVRIHTPRLRIVDRSVRVSGRVDNRTDGAVYGDVLVEVYQDDFLIASEYVSIDLAPRGSDTYELMLDLLAPDGPLRAAATWQG